MEWTRSETLALASQSCTQCHGLGLRTLSRGSASPCNCVYRAIFKACFDRFRYCATKEKSLSQVTLEYMPKGGRRSSWGRKDEEYCADFLLVSKRALTEEEYTIFRYHFLLGADWKLCTRKMELDRGLFFHAVYRIEQKLGKRYKEVEPYALYPLENYFGTCMRDTVQATMPPPVRRARKVIPIRKEAMAQPARAEVEMQRIA